MKRLFSAGIASILISAANPAAAQAAHPTQMCLDLQQEHTYDTSNDDVLYTLQAYPGATDAGHPSEHEGCVTEQVEAGQNWGGTNVDFEITGDGDTDGDTPASPDMTCTVGEGQAGCWVSPPTRSEGLQTIRGWIDVDQDDTTVEADPSEGVDETSDPGAAEPDATDAVLWHWRTMETTAESTVTIGHVRRIGGFRGQVRSSYGPCSTERTVKVFKRRTYSRRLMGTVKTNGNGTWRLAELGNVRGRFFAVAIATTRHTASPSTDMTCLRARSSTVRVR